MKIPIAPKLVRNMAIGVRLSSLGYGSFDGAPLISMLRKANPPFKRKIAKVKIAICNKSCVEIMFIVKYL